MLKSNPEKTKMKNEIQSLEDKKDFILRNFNWNVDKRRNDRMLDRLFSYMTTRDQIRSQLRSRTKEISKSFYSKNKKIMEAELAEMAVVK